MSLSEEERNTIVALEIEKAKNTFAEVEALIQAKLWNGAANRLYYAVFHAVCALLVHDRHQVNTHQGSHALFGLHYIKSGILPTEFGHLYGQLQTMRENSDYNCAYDVSIEELQGKIEPARQMIYTIEKMVHQCHC